MEFDCYELPVSGLGTWNEKYKSINKMDNAVKLDEVFLTD
mgnify:CR=1 FL=1